jgi:hypothetical protein
VEIEAIEAYGNHTTKKQNRGTSRDGYRRTSKQLKVTSSGGIPMRLADLDLDGRNTSSKRYPAYMDESG